MAEKLSIQDLSRQLLVRGTSCFTDLAGEKGFKNEDLQVSALVRIADAMERQTELLTYGSPWIPVELRLPDPPPGKAESWAVIALEYTGSQVYAVYDHVTGKWRGIGLDYEPRITHWLPAPAGPWKWKGERSDV